MTNPTPPTQDDYGSRLAAAAAAVGSDKPQLANTLANSGVSTSDMQLIGNFANSLRLASVNRIAQDAGAVTNFTPAELNALQSIGEQPANQPVAGTGAGTAQPGNSGGGWLQSAMHWLGDALSHSGSLLIHNPVTQGMFHVFDFLGHAIHYPFKLLSDEIGGQDPNVLRSMGYDPNSFGSRAAFDWSHPDSDYHSLDGARNSYGDDTVSLIVKQQANPQAFADAVASGTIFNEDGTTTKVDLSTPEGQSAMQAFQQRINSDDYKKAYNAVDALRVSPGRDLANLILAPFHANTESNVAFKLLSGTLDAAYDIAADPTLLAGRLSAGLKMADVLGRSTEELQLANEAARPLSFMQRNVYQPLSQVIPTVSWRGFRPTLVARNTSVAGIADTEGIVKALSPGGAGYDHASAFIDDANKMRSLQEQLAAAPKGTQAAYDLQKQAGQQLAYMQVRYQRTYWPFLDEVNGRRVLPPNVAVIVKNAEDPKHPLALDASQTAQKYNDTYFDQHGNAKPGAVTDKPINAGDLREVALQGTKVNIGAGLVAQGKPITSLDEFRDMFASTVGLTRMAGGEAAQRTVMMPGRLSFTGELKARLAMRGAKYDLTKPQFNTTPAKLIFNYLGRGKDSLIPHDAEQPMLDAMDAYREVTDPTQLNKYAAARGVSQYWGTVILRKLLPYKAGEGPGAAGFQPLQAAKAVRARWEQFTRRLQMQATAPKKVMATDANGNVTETAHIIHWSDPNSVQWVHQVAKYYLNRGDAARLSAAYAMGSNATRRAIIEGAILPQLMHATGVFRSEAGRVWAEDFLRSQASLDLQQYGMGETDLLSQGASAPARRAALHPAQLRDFSLVPTFDTLHYHAGKFAVGNFASRMGLATLRTISESSAIDKIMHAIKLGWITTAASGLRNSIEEMSTVIAKGLGPQWLQGRYAFTKKSQEIRAKLRQASVDFRALRNQYGDKATAFREVQSQAQSTARSYGELHKAIDEANSKLTADDALDVNKPEELVNKLSDLDRAQLEATRDQMVSQLPAAEREAEHAALMTVAIKHRIPYYLRYATDKFNDVIVANTIGKLLSLTGRLPTDQEMEWAGELVNSEISAVLREGVFQSREADDQVAEAMAPMRLARLGVSMRSYQNVVPKGAYQGWQEIEADGGRGADAWARRLNQQYPGIPSPGHVWAKKMVETNHDVVAATQAVREWLDSPEASYFVNNAEHAWTLKNGSIARTPEEHKQALDELAERQSADLLLTITKRGIPNPVKDKGYSALAEWDGQQGGIPEALLKKLAEADQHGAPDRAWLVNNVPKDERPEHVLAEQWAPVTEHQPGTLARGYTNMLTRAYGKVSVDLINAVTRNPLFTGLYMQARHATLDYEKFLLDNGWDPEVAKMATQHIALSHAQTEVFRHVDNPYVATQMSAIVRNFWAFERFQEDFLRRWGRTLRDNPTILRKYQMALAGGSAAGMVEWNDQNQPVFIYPGSAMAVGLLNKVLTPFGLGGNVQVPLHGELSSSLEYLNASLQNPLGFSGTPLITIPVDIMARLVPSDHAVLMASLKKAVEGDLGQSKKWYEEVMPETVVRILDGPAAPTEDPASRYGQAFMQALWTMEAAGQLDQIDKLGNDPNAMAELQSRLGTQTRNALMAMTLGGFFLPASPSVEWTSPAKAGVDSVGNTHLGNEADWAWHKLGYNSLQTEFKRAAADLGFEGALQWWQIAHPGELIWDEAGAGARTVAQAQSSIMPATMAAAQWMENNKAFTEKYKNVAAYFMPAANGTGNADGQYSDIAYRAQLEAGMRAFKPLDEFYKDIVIQRGEALYHDAVAPINAGISDAIARGDTATAQQLESAKATQRQIVMQSNPLLADKMASLSADQGWQQTTIQTLSDLANDNSPEARKALGGLRPGLLALLQAYDDYQTAVQPVAGRYSAQATRARRAAQQNLTDSITAIVGTAQQPGPYSELADLARGVFAYPAQN